jgi:hypothetical protein
MTGNFEVGVEVGLAALGIVWRTMVWRCGPTLFSQASAHGAIHVAMTMTMQFEAQRSRNTTVNH